MYLENARRLIEERSFPDAEDIHPCTPEEVMALERKLGAPLPGAVREFLLWCGHGLGDLWSGNRCFEYEELMRGAGLSEARQILIEGGYDTSVLDGPVLVFQFDECDQFSFVRLDEGDDPTVYGRNEGEPIRQECERFSDFVKLIVDQEFGLEPEQDEGEGVPMSSTTPPPDLAQAERPSIVPPELEPDHTWVEESYGFLPPSQQQRLGELRASFRSSAANVFAALVFGVLIIVGGLALMGLGIRDMALEDFRVPLVASEGMSWLIFGLIEIASGGIVLGGALLIRHALRLSRSRVFVGEDGLCRARDGGFELARWTEIGEIEDVVTTESLPWLKLLLLRWMPVGGSRHIVLHLTDGRELRYTPNDLRSFARFEALLRRAAAVHQLRWSVVRLRT